MVGIMARVMKTKVFWKSIEKKNVITSTRCAKSVTKYTIAFMKGKFYMNMAYYTNQVIEC